MVIVESAGLSDVGMKRRGNEDAFFHDDDLRLYIVADGMGGHQAGEVASDLVVRTITDYMARLKGKASGEIEEFEEADKTLSRDANRLIAGITLSNKVVYQAAQARSGYRGMGSTVSAVYFTDDTLIATNVGDSPIYLIRNHAIEELSKPHTVMAEHMAMQGETGERFGKEYRHMLTRAMGVEETVRADICEFPCFRGDVLVIASDGLTNKVNPREIAEVVDSRKLQKACQKLVEMANERGGDDNITVIVVKVKSVQRRKNGLMNLFSKLFQ